MEESGIGTGLKVCVCVCACGESARRKRVYARLKMMRLSPKPPANGFHRFIGSAGGTLF